MIHYEKYDLTEKDGDIIKGDIIIGCLDYENKIIYCYNEIFFEQIVYVCDMKGRVFEIR